MRWEEMGYIFYPKKINGNSNETEENKEDLAVN
jgi:hypothetical protein